MFKLKNRYGNAIIETDNEAKVDELVKRGFTLVKDEAKSKKTDQSK